LCSAPGTRWACPGAGIWVMGGVITVRSE
jgi:hypothetical protein